MASIYARYIPPAKPNLAPPTETLKAQTTTPLASADISPPPKVESSLRSENADITNISTSKRKREAVASEVVPVPATKKAKKEKPEKKAKKERSEKSGKEDKREEESAQTVQQQTLRDGEKPEENAESKRPEKRGKKDHKTRKENTSALTTPEAATLSKDEKPRHRAILEKRDESIKKAEKQAKKAALLVKNKSPEPVEEPAAIAQELHDLVPLPQPEPVPELPIQSFMSSLPSWLSAPIRVLPTDTASFIDLGIQKDAVQILQEKGFNEAFAVQAAVLPMLLPGKARDSGDILVSAATGSGKTLAYVLPMIEDVSRNPLTKLRGVIVMPTRELVYQAKEVCDICAAAFSHGKRRGVKIGTAVGSENFRTEQASIMLQRNRRDLVKRRDLDSRTNRKYESSDCEGDDAQDDIIHDDKPVSNRADNIIDPVSKIDILICTPGRLVEHLKSTSGFTLKFVQWLVIDEADKLLDQTFQNWLEILMRRLDKDRRANQELSVPNRIRKCVLSATLTKDLGQLTALKLFRPKLISLERQALLSTEVTMAESDSGHVLPESLSEFGVKAEEDSLKPLYLMEIISRENIVSQIMTKMNESDSNDTSDDDTADDDTSDNDSSSDDNALASRSKLAVHKREVEGSLGNRTRGVLIFTKSNESAVRLSRLISLLESSYASQIGTLTSTTRSSDRKSTIASFNSGKLTILVASDLVSRGLDLPDLAYVINYDMPTSVTNYVHRVGRTARAGKNGSAWTIFTATEGRWFWNEIARSQAIRRKQGTKVERVTIKADSLDETLRSRYEAALEELGREASSEHSKPKKEKT